MSVGRLVQLILVRLGYLHLSNLALLQISAMYLEMRFYSSLPARLPCILFKNALISGLGRPTLSCSVSFRTTPSENYRPKLNCTTQVLTTTSPVNFQSRMMQSHDNCGSPAQISGKRSASSGKNGEQSQRISLSTCPNPTPQTQKWFKKLMPTIEKSRR